MNNRPYGNELLAIARRTLLDELLPLLPAEKAYDALMVANAMAIATRELTPHCTQDAYAAQEISHFFNKLVDGQQTNPTEDDLAARIRQRLIPASSQQDLYKLLLSLTKAKLALCNPKYLL